MAQTLLMSPSSLLPFSDLGVSLGGHDNPPFFSIETGRSPLRQAEMDRILNVSTSSVRSGVTPEGLLSFQAEEDNNILLLMQKRTNCKVHVGKLRKNCVVERVQDRAQECDDDDDDDDVDDDVEDDHDDTVK
ncbi:hypothetical protein LEMLEM_LOCUS16551 [Lemmus lemmus]